MGSRIDVSDDIVWCASINCATDALGCAENLLDRARQFAGHRTWAHDASSGNYVVEGDITAVLN